MRQSQLFSKTRKDTPKDEVSRNAILLTRAGFIHKEMAGVYSYLPLGLRVLRKIEGIIREEMNTIGGQEVLLTALQEKDVWEKTGRWSDEVVDVWFKTLLKNESEVGLATTHEEPLTALMTEEVSSYRDLPAYVYQFQTKFRNELRAKSGIMRGREFLMKDLYSFSRTHAEHEKFYESVKDAYIKIFKKVGVGESTYLTFASGGSFSRFSHEFQTVTQAGEDTIFLAEDKGLAVNKEVFTDEVLDELGLKKGELKEARAVEIGNIFTLGTKFSEPLRLSYKDEDGEDKPVIMGSYGIGLGRLMGTVAEVLSDESGLVWPKEIAPFRAHLIVIGEDEGVRKVAEEIYKTLNTESIEVLYDDRDVRAGEKFADSDLIGIPTRIIVSEKTLESNTLEVKDRATGEIVHLSIANAVEYLKR